MGIDWTIVDEIRLYRWVGEFKPAGINKHFHMLCIVERMNHPDKYPVTLLQKDVVKTGKFFTAEDIWEKLSSTYNLAEIDRLEDQEIETVPRNNDTDGDLTMLESRQRLRQIRDFELPWDEYGELILENARNGVYEEGQDILEEDEAASSTPTASEREDEEGPTDKRRAARTQKPSRLMKPSDEEGGSSKESSDNEADESKEESDEPTPEEDANEKEEGSSEQPLAKRTRHSSQTRATNDTSPKRKKRTTDQPAKSSSVVPTRVSSRLRNRKQ